MPAPPKSDWQPRAATSCESPSEKYCLSVVTYRSVPGDSPAVAKRSRHLFSAPLTSPSQLSFSICHSSFSILQAHGGVGSLPMVSHAGGVIDPPKRSMCRFPFVTCHL